MDPLLYSYLNGGRMPKPDPDASTMDPTVRDYLAQKMAPPPAPSSDDVGRAHNMDVLFNVFGGHGNPNAERMGAEQQAQAAAMARSKAMEEADPNSQTSQAHRAVVAQMMPTATKLPGWERMSSSMLKSVLPGSDKLIESSDKRYGVEHEDTRSAANLGGENARAATSATEANRHNLADEANARARIEMEGKKAGSDRVEAQREKQLEALQTQLAAIEEMGKPLARLQASASAGAPGHGALVGRFLPDSMVSEAGVDARQDARHVATLYAQVFKKPGSPLKSPEQIQSQFGLADNATPTALKMGVQKMLAEIADRKQQIRRGFAPEVVGEYDRRAGAETPSKPEASATPAAAQRITRTDPATGETRTWDGKAWVKG